MFVLAVTLVVSVAGSRPAAGAVIEGGGSADGRAVRIGNQQSTKPLPPSPFATYRVSIVSDWTAASHPTTRPSGSHFSPTVIANHLVPGALFAVGTFASPGIERMAETGATTTLRNELLDKDVVRDVQVGSSIFGVGQNSFVINANTFDDYVSLVTMIAPSPDWFVGVRDVELLRADGWVDRLELDLKNYDAGTDSGTAFRSPNFDTNPAQLISGPRDPAFAAAAAEGRFGRVIIERVS